ncbi:LemA family protein [Pseudomonas syringae pv. actinidiae]|nr:LemA family protein [Pseudomonas syringae pv. actinidiae]
MTNDIITIIPSALAITAPLVIGSMLLSNYNGITSLRRGIDISLSEISHAIIQRNNEFPRLIEKMQGQLKEVDKYFLETNTARRTSKRAVELRDVVKISSAEEKMKQSISDMLDDVQYSGVSLEDVTDFSNKLNEYEKCIHELKNQYNFKVEFYNSTLDSIPYVVISKILRLQKLSNLTF